MVNEAGEESPLKAGDFALVNPDEKHQYRNKGDKPFKMICGVPKEFEYIFGKQKSAFLEFYIMVSFFFPLSYSLIGNLSSFPEKIFRKKQTLQGTS